jgi:ATP-dependent DNA ligase
VIKPPIAPMLAKLLRDFPEGEGWIYEPKWDGFRALVFKDGDRLYTQSRDQKPLDRYFPDLKAPLLANLPERAVVDGEIVIATDRGLDFSALQLRLHPAASRVEKLAAEAPASFVAFDLLALGDEVLLERPFAERRTLLEQSLAKAKPPIFVTPATRDPAVAKDWFQRFEGAGLDGVIAKPVDLRYQPDKRVMVKIKHRRTADCVVAGFRWHKNGKGTLIGSLLLGLYDPSKTLHHVGVTSSFTMEKRRALVQELEPLRDRALEGHPWAEWAGLDEEDHQRRPGMGSRWNAGKDLSWEPLRLERVAEVAYDGLQGDRFRHGTTFVRWRPDKQPADCDYAQLEASPPYELQRIFGLQPHSDETS